MKLNWFFTNVTVLIMLCGLIGSTNAMAAVRRPQRCEVCCPPSGCDYGQYFTPTMTTHVAVANTAYSGQKPTKASLLVAAANIDAYAEQIQTNGTAAPAQAALIASIDNGTFFNTALDAGPSYQEEAAYNNTIAQAGLQEILNTVVQRNNRQWAADYIEQNGIVETLEMVSTILTLYANEYGEHYPVNISPGFAHAIFDTMAFAGAILVATDDPIGWVLMAGGYAGNTYMNVNGM